MSRKLIEMLPTAENRMASFTTMQIPRPNVYVRLHTAGFKRESVTNLVRGRAVIDGRRPCPTE